MPRKIRAIDRHPWLWVLLGYDEMYAKSLTDIEAITARTWKDFLHPKGARRRKTSVLWVFVGSKNRVVKVGGITAREGYGRIAWAAQRAALGADRVTELALQYEDGRIFVFSDDPNEQLTFAEVSEKLT